MSCIGDIQSLLLAAMGNVASSLICKNSSGLVIADETERRCFVNAAIAFCKLQHLNPNLTVKTQVSQELILYELVKSVKQFFPLFHPSSFLLLISPAFLSSHFRWN